MAYPSQRQIDLLKRLAAEITGDADALIQAMQDLGHWDSDNVAAVIDMLKAEQE